MRELHPHAALPEGVVCPLPPRRPRDRRRAHARVRVRARRLERAAGGAEHGIRYPVAVDDSYGTWDAWGNQYWPADYLIDRNGDVRDAHFGEGAYTQTQDDIRSLLGEHGTGPMAHAHDGDHAVDQRRRRPRPTSAPTAPPPTPSSCIPSERLGLRRRDGDGDEHGRARRATGGVESHQIVAGAGAQLLFDYVAPRIYLVAAPPAPAAGHARRLGRRQAARTGARARRRPLPARPHADGRAAPARPVRAGGHVALLVHVRVASPPAARSPRAPRPRRPADRAASISCVHVARSSGSIAPRFSMMAARSSGALP